MNTRQITFSALALLTIASRSPAQFVCGSTGLDGALNVTSSNTTVPLPPNGVLNYTTVTVASGRTLTFTRNEKNTPVYVLATGDINIAGTVNVDGQNGSASPPVGGAGGPEGFAGGAPGGGPGQGPGGGGPGNDSPTGGAGVGVYSQTPGDSNDGATYGSPLLVPLAGGSGGGGADSYGGGAILLASNTLVNITGSILARGGDGVPFTDSRVGSGSGGGIRIVATTVSGNGTIDVRGGHNGVFLPANYGRIRIDAINRQFTYNFQPSSQASVGGFMVVSPTNAPRLDIISAAGTTVAVDSGPVLVLLPYGSPATQTVVVQAQNFTGNVPIAVAVIPESGARTDYNVDIDMNTNPDTVSVNVTLPINTLTRIMTWTR